MDTPIRTEADYASAVAEVNRLWGSDPGTPEGDRLDLLLILIAAYEDEHDAIDPPDPIDAIIERMTNLGMTRADLGTMLGATSGRVSEILNRHRPLSIEMIRKLASGHGLSERCLLLDTAARAKTLQSDPAVSVRGGYQGAAGIYLILQRGRQTANHEQQAAQQAAAEEIVGGPLPPQKCMSLETYWLVVPPVGIGLTVPFWVWIWLTRPKRKAAAQKQMVLRFCQGSRQNHQSEHHADKCGNRLVIMCGARPTARK